MAKFAVDCGRSFSDTESAKDSVQHIVGLDLAADLTESIKRPAQFQRKQFIADPGVTGCERRVETCHAAFQAIPRAGRCRGEPLAVMGGARRKAMADLFFQLLNSGPCSGRD